WPSRSPPLSAWGGLGPAGSGGLAARRELAPQHSASLCRVASHRQDDRGGAPPRGSGVNRADIDPLPGQPGRDPSECPRLVPEPQREHWLLSDPVLRLAERALGPGRVADEQTNLPAAGHLVGAERDDVDAGVGEGTGKCGECARSRDEAERELSRFWH